METTTLIDGEVRKRLQDLIEGKTQEELMSILQQKTLEKDYLEKILIDRQFCLLRDGSYIIRPNRDFGIHKFEETGIETKEVNNLNEAWEFFRKNYLEPYSKDSSFPEGHINTIKAKDLYPIINKFLIDNDLRGTNDKVYYNFPICDKFYNNKVFGLVATSKNKKALIEITKDSEYLRHAIDSEKIETYQDYLDKKHI